MDAHCRAITCLHTCANLFVVGAEDTFISLWHYPDNEGCAHHHKSLEVKHKLIVGVQFIEDDLVAIASYDDPVLNLLSVL